MFIRKFRVLRKTKITGLKYYCIVRDGNDNGNQKCKSMASRYSLASSGEDIFPKTPFLFLSPKYRIIGTLFNGIRKMVIGKIAQETLNSLKPQY